MRIAFLMTSFNRQEKTVSCINRLIELSSDANIDKDIYLLDDHSSDDTPTLVANRFPQVKLSRSIGNCYWGRGMYLAWYEALKVGYDAYIWVNDDNELYDYALAEMLDCMERTNRMSIICGTFCGENGEITYGGADINQRRIVPSGKMEKVTYMNGNFVLVPASVVEKIGMIDPVFKHIKGDYDYGFTAIETGINVWTTTRYVGVSNANPLGKSRGRFYGRGFKGRIYDSFHSPFLENPAISLYFNIKHGKGVIRSGFLFIKAIIVDMIPDKVYKFLH